MKGGAGPALWSAEEPNLYILVLSLIAPDGSHVESESCQVRMQTGLTFPSQEPLSSNEQFPAASVLSWADMVGCAGAHQCPLLLSAWEGQSASAAAANHNSFFFRNMTYPAGLHMRHTARWLILCTHFSGIYTHTPSCLHRRFEETSLIDPADDTRRHAR